MLGVSLFFLSSAFGEILSVGVRGGVPFTGALSDLTTHGVDIVTRSFSDSNQYIVGPMVELHLPLGLSIEAGRLVVDPKKRRRYSLDELLAQCQPSARRSREERDWLKDPPVGRELI